MAESNDTRETFEAFRDVVSAIDSGDTRRLKKTLVDGQSSAHAHQSGFAYNDRPLTPFTARPVKELKRNPHTVRDWLKRYNGTGLKGLSRKYSPGCRGKFHSCPVGTAMFYRAWWCLLYDGVFTDFPIIEFSF